MNLYPYSQANLQKELPIVKISSDLLHMLFYKRQERPEIEILKRIEICFHSCP
jgi:hypothetical protein